ncbi:DUF1622 domain-containing protein [Phytohabitans flavus]|uniref:Membrane protein n=1 Tax=Phytohabitans flavus TaxID=1076124 RepID=A0A6F8XQI8_9ACTN|nr:DUF1622 domain-containing protein [Phytohabitans flavus]BCB76102.1 membrane protein [Phytohabitans flavus]
MGFEGLIEHVARGFELAGVAVLIVGLVWSAAVAVRLWRRAGGRRAYQAVREFFGGSLLLGLEVLVAADLIRTVAVNPTLESVAVLGLIVLIRTFLSFSLQIEIDGVPPWRRAMTSGATLMARGASRANSSADPSPSGSSSSSD